MAASLNELLKPGRFDVDPSSPKAAKQLKLWLRVYTDFIDKYGVIARSQQADAPDKLRTLFAYVSADVYEMIEDCATYDAAVSKLKRSFRKVTKHYIRKTRLSNKEAKTGRTFADIPE